ncbi:glycerate kinase [Brucella pseudogrignonensis]|uniref:Hydroxypyruvate reductase n=1 Tax=Brucella pseudogrignonensis TaxID=419475 RepID=A0ABU1MC54_9HYPH|nr:glycerate kinase [Brucella pseudogrignonensis]MDR6433616.1 hydroxypyruvate reductase [Brucella pseudogrignonensis]
MIADTKTFFDSLFRAAVAAADPALSICKFLPSRPKGRTIVIGAGKASSQMAAALENNWQGQLEGVVVTRYGYAAHCEKIEILEAAHPVPDQAGLLASQRLFEAVSDLTENDLVIALVSGGGSALLPAPPEGMSLADEIVINDALLASGAPIAAMNTVRKQLSKIKGGRLALAAWPAKLVTLVVSDIPGDDPALVASGPTIADQTTRADALRIIDEYKIRLPKSAIRHLSFSEVTAPLPYDERLRNHRAEVIASAALSLEAAAKYARRQGIEAVILSDSIEGEARDVAGVHAAIAREIKLRNRPFPKPILLLSGGETTVTLRGKSGKGGRNSEFLLALAIALQGLDGVCAFAADTDGIDGSESNAGAFVTPDTLVRMREADVDPGASLSGNDSWTAFNSIQDLYMSGPTGTNVNDLRAILIT